MRQLEFKVPGPLAFAPLVGLLIRLTQEPRSCQIVDEVKYDIHARLFHLASFVCLFVMPNDVSVLHR